MQALRFVLAGGGTGGHLYPGIAVAHALRQRFPSAAVTFLTTTRPLDHQLLAPTTFAQVTQTVRPLSLHPLRLPGFLWHWHRSVARATRLFRAERPNAVLGLGGYAAGPPVVAARRLGIPTAILNPDAIPGRANRHLARYADLVIVQWDHSREHFPPGTKVAVLGCPIRAAFAGASGGHALFGLETGRPVLLVTGASQGARTVNEALIRVWPAFHKAHPEWQLLHLTGPSDEVAVRKAYAVAGVPATVLGFTAEMAAALAAADLVVARAGASTLAELTALGKPAILLPYPYHRDRHQHANGQVLVDQGAAVMLEDRLRPELNAAPLRTALDRLADETVRRAMAAAAAALGRPAAALEVAERLAALGGN